MIGDRILGLGAAGVVIGYRRLLSPYKGFQCPHNMIHGEGSCSDFGLDVFRKAGFFAGLRQLRTRFSECRMAAQAMMSEAMANKDDKTETDNRKKEKWYDRWCGDCGLGWPSCGGRQKKGDLDGADCGGADCDIIPDCSW